MYKQRIVPCMHGHLFLLGLSEWDLTILIPACGKQHHCYLPPDSGAYDSHVQKGFLKSLVLFLNKVEVKFNQEVIKVLNQRIKKCNLAKKWGPFLIKKMLGLLLRDSPKIFSGSPMSIEERQALSVVWHTCGGLEDLGLWNQTVQ